MSGIIISERATLCIKINEKHIYHTCQVAKQGDKYYFKISEETIINIGKIDSDGNNVLNYDQVEMTFADDYKLKFNIVEGINCLLNCNGTKCSSYVKIINNTPSADVVLDRIIIGVAISLTCIIGLRIISKTQ